MILDFPPQGVLLALTRQERQTLLHDTTAVPPHILHKIEAAPWEGEGVRVWLSLDDIEELLTGVSWEASHATCERRDQLFLDLYDRLAAMFAQAVGLDRMGGIADPLRELIRGFVQLMAEANVDPDSVRQELARLIDEQNTRSLTELGGLSPDQAFLLNNCGWWADPFPIRLEPNLSFQQVGQTELFRNVRAFLQAVEEFEGAPTTAKGNLTRAFVGHMLELLSLPPGHLEMIRQVCKVINESDVWTLHIVRVICQVGRLVRKRKKRFVITRKARGLLQEDRAGGLYYHLFDTMFRQFNLDYLTRLHEVPGIQATIPYALYRIGQLPVGQDHDFESLVPMVFVPTVHEEIGAVSSHGDMPQWLLKDLLLRPLESLGLVKIVAGERKPPSVSLKTRVRRLPLFDAFIRFDI
ncbi:MAG TPA: hypothetical protein VM537_28430 [Anaerolineae bacterium]|nr:hypothetical protein [Anaerolineae bacterium]